MRLNKMFGRKSNTMSFEWFSVVRWFSLLIFLQKTNLRLTKCKKSRKPTQEALTVFLLSYPKK